MKKFAILLCTIMLMTSSVLADEEYFTSICVEDKAVGLRWDELKKEWEHTEIKPTKYIVAKLQAEEPKGSVPKSGFCYYDIKKKSDISLGSDRLLSHGCYNIREVGTEFNSGYSEMCNEIWQEDKNKKILLSVSCLKIKLMPNGIFQYGEINDAMRWGSYKKMEEIYTLTPNVSVGKCSQI